MALCLIVFAYQCHPDFNLILAANRDEFYARPSRALHAWPAPAGIVAGQDLEQGGTWLGLTGSGRFSALTNHRDGQRPASGTRSRGQLVVDFLTSSLDSTHFARVHTQTGQEHYDGYNQLIGDQHGLFYLANDTAHNQRLTPGVHGISNARLNSPWPKLEQQKQVLQQHLTRNQLQPEHLIRAMADPQRFADPLLPDTGISLEWERALSASFIRQPNYGTRATTIIRQDYDGVTEIVEQSYDQQGATEQTRVRLQLPPIGGINRVWSVASADPVPNP